MYYYAIILTKKLIMQHQKFLRITSPLPRWYFGWYFGTFDESGTWNRADSEIVSHGASLKTKFITSNSVDGERKDFSRNVPTRLELSY